MELNRLKNDLVAAIDMEIMAQTGKVASGGCADMKEYGKVCGVIEGLTRSREAVKKAFNKLIEEEDS